MHPQNILVVILISFITSLRLTHTNWGPFMKCHGEDISHYRISFVTHDTIYVSPKETSGQTSKDLKKRIRTCEECNSIKSVNFITGTPSLTQTPTKIQTEPTMRTDSKEVKGTSIKLPSITTLPWFLKDARVSRRECKYLSRNFFTLVRSEILNISTEKMRFAVESVRNGMSLLVSESKKEPVSRSGYFGSYSFWKRSR